MSVVEKRRLGMHPDLLLNVIQRQAGTLHKAILEGVMNAVDAQATKIDVEVTTDSLVIRDNGIGMATRAHIEKFWEVFGQKPEEGERKTYGQFRMGRGQLFAFGKNTWTTGKFILGVDIKNQGLDYGLTQVRKEAKGCEVRVELYDTLMPSDKAQLERELAASIKYVPAEIRFNGELLSVDPETQEWDQITDEAYIRLKTTGSLYVFNLGVLVCAHSGYVFGCGGEVVSRKQLKVNFARNEVMSDCPVWKTIKPIVNQRADDNAKKTKTLTDDARQRLCNRLKSGLLSPDEARSAKILTDVNGRHWSLDSIQHHKWQGSLTCCKPGDSRGTAVMAHKLAFVFSMLTLERLGVTTVQGLIDTLRTARSDALKYFKVVPFEELTSAADAHCELVDEKEWTVTEKTVMYVLNSAIWKLISEEKDYNDRMRVVVGLAEKVVSWTDAKTYIAISRATIEALGCDLKSWITYCHLLVRNYAAEEANHEMQRNSPEFYQEVQRLVEERLPEMFDNCVMMLPRAVEYLERKMTREQLKDADRVQKHQDAESKLQGMIKPSDN